MSQGKNWCFTLNACEEDGEHIVWVTPGVSCPVASWMDSGKIQYLVCQVERVAHVHVQGYVQFTGNMRLAGLKKISPGAHWEIRRGTHKQARDYAMKEESRVNGPWELGEAKDSQGKRTDLEAIAALVKARKTNLEILDEAGACASKFSKQIQFLRFTYSESESDRSLQGVRVLVLYGATGTGKTYAAINYIAGNTDYYICEAPSHINSKVWFDGYEGQRTLILDDFDGSFCAFRYLLRLLDKYKLKIEVKGGFAWASWTTVVITSNLHPCGWYTTVDCSPLRRRISEIRLLEHQGTYKLVDWTEKVTSTDFENFTVSAVQPPRPASPVASTSGTAGDSTQVVPDTPPQLRLHQAAFKVPSITSHTTHSPTLPAHNDSSATTEPYSSPTPPWIYMLTEDEGSSQQ